MKQHSCLAVTFALLLIYPSASQAFAGQAIAPSRIDSFDGHPRLIVISDIGNEPDDQMSLTRLLLYSNELDIEALIAGTSTWQKTVIHPETMRALITAYGQVRPNLLQHATGWPPAEDLNNRVYSGQPGYGMAATGAGKTSEGAQAVRPSTPTGGEYYYATWTGISGDLYYRNCAGADPSLVTNEWLDKNIRSKGPLGKLYPRFLFIMEGDTPSWLGLIDNGLDAYARPDWGGWGGRYIFRQPYGETHPIWTQGGDLFSRVTSQDEVTGIDDSHYISDQATIWRWREAYQNDFTARMDWTVNDYKHANHCPVLEVNGTRGTGPIYLDVKVGQPLTLDAGASHDPDGQRIQYHWFHYSEAGSTEASLAAVAIAGSQTAKAVVTATSTCRPGWLKLGPGCPAEGIAHIILAATDDGSLKLTSYRRVVLRVHADSGK